MNGAGVDRFAPGDSAVAFLFVGAKVRLVVEQFRLDFSAPPHTHPRKPTVRGSVVSPPCDACSALGRDVRDPKCKKCKNLYIAAWKRANPDRWGEIQARYLKRERAKRAEKPKRPKAKSFRERYRTDFEFREAHKAKRRAWAAANPEKIAAKSERQKPTAKRGYKRCKHPPLVYFIRSYLTGMIKIGTTTRLPARLIDFRCALPGRLEVLGVMSGSHALEAEIHARFAAQRFDREWFVETPALIDFIHENARDQCPDLGGVSLAPGEGLRLPCRMTTTAPATSTG